MHRQVKAQQAKPIPVKEPEFAFDFALHHRQVAKATAYGQIADKVDRKSSETRHE